jgi:hypothetical protein
LDHLHDLCLQLGECLHVGVGGGHRFTDRGHRFLEGVFERVLFPGTGSGNTSLLGGLLHGGLPHRHRHRKVI